MPLSLKCFLSRVALPIIQPCMFGVCLFETTGFTIESCLLQSPRKKDANRLVGFGAEDQRRRGSPQAYSNCNTSQSRTSISSESSGRKSFSTRAWLSANPREASPGSEKRAERAQPTQPTFIDRIRAWLVVLSVRSTSDSLPSKSVDTNQINLVFEVLLT